MRLSGWSYPTCSWTSCTGKAELFQQSNNPRNTRLDMARASRERRTEDPGAGAQAEGAAPAVRQEPGPGRQKVAPALELEEAEDRLAYLLGRLDLAREADAEESRFEQTQVAELETALRRMATNLTVVKQNLDHPAVKAPVGGQLTSLNAKVGESKSRGRGSGRSTSWRVSRCARRSTSTTSRGSRPASAARCIAGKTYRLTITKVYLEVVAGRSDVDLGFAGEEPPGVRRGQTLHVRLALGAAAEAVLLPLGGFYQQTAGRWIDVWIVRKRATRRAIRIGLAERPLLTRRAGRPPAGERAITSSYEALGEVEELELQPKG